MSSSKKNKKQEEWFDNDECNNVIGCFKITLPFSFYFVLALNSPTLEEKPPRQKLPQAASQHIVTDSV